MTTGVAEGLTAVCEVAEPVIDPHAVGLADVGQGVVVCNPCIEIAISIEVTEGDIEAIGVAEGLAAVCEAAQSIVDPHAIGLVVFVGDPCIEIAITIEVTEGDTGAIGAAECLTAVGEVAGHSPLNAALVDPHAVG